MAVQERRREGQKNETNLVRIPSDACTWLTRRAFLMSFTGLAMTAAALLEARMTMAVMGVFASLLRVTAMRFAVKTVGAPLKALHHPATCPSLSVP